MIISHGRSYIFVHIPKTGGTALTLALEERAKKDDLMIGDTPKGKRRRRRLPKAEPPYRYWKHSRLADIEDLVAPQGFEAFFVVTLVRNPWDRMVSYYHWLKAQHFENPAVALAKRLPFGPFVAELNTQQAFRQTPVRAYLTDRAGVEHCQLAARLEHFDEDIKPFERHLKFRVSPLAKVNTSKRQSDYRGYYTDDTAEIVGKISEEDIRRFGYAF